MPGIKGKVVAITGTRGGIGEATALMLAAHGAKVVLGARGPERLQVLAARIAAAGGDATCVPTDVRRQIASPGYESTRSSAHATECNAERRAPERERDGHRPPAPHPAVAAVEDAISHAGPMGQVS